MSKKQKKILVKQKTSTEVFAVFQRNDFSTGFPPGSEPPVPVRGPRLSFEIKNALLKPQELSTLDALVNKLCGFIEGGHSEDFSQCLQADYLLSSCRDEESEKVESLLNCETKVTSVHRIFEVRPNIEQLVLSRAHFIALLTKIKERGQQVPCKTGIALFSALASLQLEDTEGADFSGLDLSKASFKNARLGASQFSRAVTTEVEFYGADLRLTDITQEQLDESADYRSAKLPPGCFCLWDDALRRKLYNCFLDMQSYAKAHIPNTDPKFIEITWLCDKYKFDSVWEKDPGREFKAGLVSDLTKAKESTFSKHRNLYFLIKECLAMLGLLFVGYLVLSTINFRKTGYFGIFTQPVMRKKVDEVERLLLQAG